MKLYSETLPLKLLTPCWISGANQTLAEWRVASLRGQLRWWLRALSPGSGNDVILLGGTPASGGAMQSSLLRITSSPMGNADQDTHRLETYRATRQDADETYFLWPFENEEKKRGVWMPRAGDAGFDLSWQCLRPVPPAALAAWRNALNAFALLGTIGGRGARGYGSMWRRTDAPADSASLSHALAFLPPHVRVRLLSDAHSHPRLALAYAARWWKSLRAGSGRSGVTPSTEGESDHHLGLDILDGRPLHNRRVHRPVLGLPLAQNYTRPGRGKLSSKFNNLDRQPSPVHLKLIKLGSDYRVVVIVFDHDDYRWPAGTTVRISGSKDGMLRSANVQISHDILNNIMAAGIAIH